MINILSQPATCSLVGNSVSFEIESDTQEQIDIKVIVQNRTIALSGYPYPKNGTYQAAIDISGVLHSFFDTESSVTDHNTIISILEDFVLDYSVQIGDKTISNLKAINGGISENLASTLIDFGLDAFSYRLNSTDRSFLFTTRTNSPHIKLRESEIFPFVFLHPGKSISFKTANNRMITLPALAKGTACLMDFNTLRKTFYELYNEVPSYFQVLLENSYTFDITFTPNAISESAYFLRFRNSLGGFEQMEITGKPYFTPEFSEENTWQKLNARNTFEERRSRLSMKRVVTAETGYKSNEELHFLMDLLCSDQIYLITQDETISRCHVVASSEIKIALPITTPHSIELKIRSVNDNKYYSPKMDLAAPGAWVLETSFWNDFARWKDNKKWND